ncbi:Mitotic spindle assembly checkpoint protein MAD2A [Oryzias melastigma]|uniref:Mitotic spindle assembly checkpoint protein MAD2A n=1 Tax=Oryzias melastigma TaxID=30732 RepID=A0A834CKG0_ORYME|nr:Mitotic spindle assembly checkpoint protein MAD2A [Oryzias melastigma]
MTSTLKGITLKGSAELVAEFFSFGINSILYQRGIYPPETFTRVTHYDMSLQVTTEPKLNNYLTNVVSQLKEWLFECSVQKLVLVITCLETNEVLERWQFDIECDKSAKESSAPREKSIKTIQDEIRSVIRQITATVTFLPLLETQCEFPSVCQLFCSGVPLTSLLFFAGSFDLLVYTDKDLVVPEKWEESGPQIIDQSEEVRLRSFTTSIHKVSSMVAYKRTDSA